MYCRKGKFRSQTTDRYSRQVLFAEIGDRGQRKIGDSRVAVIGCGALGTVSAEMLTRAGVGALRIIDRDFVEESNLQRQSLFTEEDARQGIPKALAAEKALGAINSQVEVEGIVEDVTFENIVPLCRDRHVIVDGTDNFETRYLINDYSVKEEVPWVYGACLASYGIAFAFQPGKTPCLRCLFEDPPEAGRIETCDTAGILAPVVHAVAAYQVAQVMKLLVGQAPAPQLFQVDVWESSARTSSVERARDGLCLCCGKRHFRFLNGRETGRFIRLCGRNAVQISPRRRSKLDFAGLAKPLERSGKVAFNEYMMRIGVGKYEIALFPDGRAIIRGTEDFSEARTVYARYVGS